MGKTPPQTHTNEYSVYDTKQSDAEVPVKLEFGGMQSTPSLSWLRGSLWYGGGKPDRVIYGSNRTAYNRTVLTLKLRNYDIQNIFK